MGRFIGLLLLVFGFFWMAFSGLCTLAFGISFAQNNQTIGDLMPVLLIGVPSTFGGYLIFSYGRWLANKSNE